MAVDSAFVKSSPTNKVYHLLEMTDNLVRIRIRS